MANKVQVTLPVASKKDPDHYEVGASVSADPATVTRWYHPSEPMTLNEGKAWLFIRQKGNPANVEGHPYTITCDEAIRDCELKFIRARPIRPIPSCTLRLVRVAKAGVACGLQFVAVNRVYEPTVPTTPTVPTLPNPPTNPGSGGGRLPTLDFDFVPLAAKPVPVDALASKESDRLRVVLDLKQGYKQSNGLAGAIFAIIDKATGENTINLPIYGQQGNGSSQEDPYPSKDLGRGINICPYRWPKPLTLHGQTAEIGNNLNESGDISRTSSKLNSWGESDTTLYTDIEPNQWGMKDVRTGATFRKWLRPDGNVLHAFYEMIWRDTDTERQVALAQELPCCYANGNYSTVVCYDGDAPYTNDGLREFTVREFAEFHDTPGGHYLSEGWIAVKKPDGRALGMILPTCRSAIGQFGGRNSSRSDGTDFFSTYIGYCPIMIIDGQFFHRHAVEFIVGTIAEIRARAYASPLRMTDTPEYRFNQPGRQDWHFNDKCQDAGYQNSRTSWRVTLGGNRAGLISPAGCWTASKFKKLYIHMAYTGQQSNLTFVFRRARQKEGPVDPSNAVESYRYTGGNFYRDEQMVKFPVIGDGQYRTYTIDLTGNTEFYGTINEFRLEYHYKDVVPAGEVIDTKWISANANGPA